MDLEPSKVKHVLSESTTKPELEILDLIMEEDVIKTSSPTSVDY